MGKKDKQAESAPNGGEIRPEKIKLGPRQKDDGYIRPPKTSQRWVPALY